MSINSIQTKHIAKLANIAINEQQCQTLTLELNAILKTIEKMQQVNTDKATPMAHPRDEQAILRMDVVTQSDQREAFLPLAPKVSNDLFVVPKVID